MVKPEHAFSPEVQEVIADFIPICRNLAKGRGRYAISVGGSQGKGTWDKRSDVDFRLFHEQDLPWIDTDPDLWQDYFEGLERWKQRGIIIDGVWARKIDRIDNALDSWLNGEIKPDDLVWTIWGYHLLPDIYHQAVLEDPFQVIAGWKQRLQNYPPKLKKAVLDKYLGSVRYWHDDYHYRNKVARGDIVFTAGLSARLVHDLIQILFALNDTYYVGDGQNLDFVSKFCLKPEEFAAKVKFILYPNPSNDPLKEQYDALAGLIDEVILLAEPHVTP